MEVMHIGCGHKFEIPVNEIPRYLNIICPRCKQLIYTINDLVDSDKPINKTVFEIKKLKKEDTIYEHNI